MKYIPTWCCKSIFDVDYSVLKENNIKCILSDLDNTLAPYNVAIPTEEVMQLIQKLKDEGFVVIIVSNNTGKRVQTFASDLDINYIAGAKKPFTFTIKKYLEEKNIDINDCVLIGDQMMTDIKCANKLNCRCILTAPLSEDESILTFVNRKIDKYLRKKYKIVETCKKIDRSGR